MDIRLNIIKTKWNILVSQKKVQLNFTVEIHDSNNTKIMTQIDHRLNSNEVVKKYYHAVKKDDCERLDKAYKHFMTRSSGTPTHLQDQGHSLDGERVY